MLIGTAVVGATTMVFGIIMMLKGIFPDTIEKLSLVHPEPIMGLLMGGAVVYWFTGASTQAVVTGAYRAVVYIKENMKLDAATASIEASKEVVRICTQYAQRGMVNIFIVVFCFSLSLAFFDPFFFIGYLVGMAFFGLYQAHLHGQRRRRVGQRQENRRSGIEDEKHPAPRRRPSSATPWATHSRTPHPSP